jgi:hypothetical protein
MPPLLVCSRVQAPARPCARSGLRVRVSNGLSAPARSLAPASTCPHRATAAGSAGKLHRLAPSAGVTPIFSPPPLLF